MKRLFPYRNKVNFFDPSPAAYGASFTLENKRYSIDICMEVTLKSDIEYEALYETYVDLIKSYDELRHYYHYEDNSLTLRTLSISDAEKFFKGACVQQSSNNNDDDNLLPLRVVYCSNKKLFIKFNHLLDNAFAMVLWVEMLILELFRPMNDDRLALKNLINYVPRYRTIYTLLMMACYLPKALLYIFNKKKNYKKHCIQNEKYFRKNVVSNSENFCLSHGFTEKETKLIIKKSKANGLTLTQLVVLELAKICFSSGQSSCSIFVSVDVKLQAPFTQLLAEGNYTSIIPIFIKSDENIIENLRDEWRLLRKNFFYLLLWLTAKIKKINLEECDNKRKQCLLNVKNEIVPEFFISNIGKASTFICVQKNIIEDYSGYNSINKIPAMIISTVNDCLFIKVHYSNLALFEDEVEKRYLQLIHKLLH